VWAACKSWNVTEDIMVDTAVHTNWDQVLIGIPFVMMMIIGIFRLDELVAVPHKKLRRARPASGMDSKGRPIVCDPDGTRWGRQDHRR
jgi:hypothetical protein